MKLQIVKGSVSQIVTVFIQDSSSTTGAGLGSLDQTSSIVGGYVRAGSVGVALAVDEDVTTEGTYQAPSTAGKVRIGTPANMRTGTYELHFHNDLFTSGADNVFITLGGASNMADLVLEIQLTALDLNAGTVNANLTQILGTVLTETPGQIAGRFKDFFDQAAAMFNVATALASFRATVLDAASTRAALGLAAANLDTQLSANLAAIQGVSNVTRLSVALPKYLDRPVAGDKAVKVEFALKDTDGNMEDPDGNQLAVTVYNSAGTSRDTLLYKENALTNALDAGSGTFSAYKQLERSAAGLYSCFVKIASDATEEELFVKVGWEEDATALYEYRATQVLDVANDLGVLLTRCSESRLAELDPANLPADVAANLTAIGNLNDLAAGAQMDLVNAPNATAVTAIQSGLSTHDTAAVQTAANAALVALHLDHLLAVDYDPASKPGVATALLNEIVEDDGGVSRFSANTLEQAPSAGTNPNVLINTTAATVASQTEITLTAGSNDDDAYNAQAIVIYDASDSDYPSVRKVSGYVGATKTVTLDSAPDFTMLAGDGVKIFVTAPGTTAPTANQVADAFLDRTDGVETDVTPRQYMQRIGAVAAGELSGAGTVTETFLGLDGVTTRVIVTAQQSGNRTVVQYF